LADLGFGTKEASIEAIRKMKFVPAQLEGRAVAVWIPITFRFELQA
jgi:outer membrane biosynthesis protein TonB